MFLDTVMVPTVAHILIKQPESGGGSKIIGTPPTYVFSCVWPKTSQLFLSQWRLDQQQCDCICVGGRGALLSLLLGLWACIQVIQEIGDSEPKKPPNNIQTPVLTIRINHSSRILFCKNHGYHPGIRSIKYHPNWGNNKDQRTSSIQQYSMNTHDSRITNHWSSSIQACSWLMVTNITSKQNLDPQSSTQLARSSPWGSLHLPCNCYLHDCGRHQRSNCNHLASMNHHEASWLIQPRSSTINLYQPLSLFINLYHLLRTIANLRHH